MVKKIEKSNKKIWIVIFAIAFILSLILLRELLQQNSSSINQNSIGNQTNLLRLSPTLSSSKKYYSNFLKLTIDVPDNFDIEEKYGEIILSKRNVSINIHGVGTNRTYSNINEFFNDSFSSDNLPKKIEKNYESINGIDCIVSIAEYNDFEELNGKSYICYKNANSFLSFSTSSTELYSDLDRIARSFRYEP